MSRQSYLRWNVTAVILVGLGGFALRTLSAQQDSSRDSSAAMQRDAALPMTATLLQTIVK